MNKEAHELMLTYLREHRDVHQWQLFHKGVSTSYDFALTFTAMEVCL